MSKDIVSDIDAVLSGGIFGSRVAELDLILNKVFPDSDKADQREFDHYAHCELRFQTDCYEVTRAEIEGLGSWYEHPARILVDSDRAIHMLQYRLDGLEKAIEFRVSRNLNISTYVLAQDYARHLIACAVDGIPNMKWDAWLFLEENPDFGLDTTPEG